VIDLYFWPTPNGHKASIMLEEVGLQYEVHPVNILKGDQFDPDFIAISRNNRIPAIVDRDGPGGAPFSVFESGAILMYLAEKTGMLLPRDTAEKYVVLQWLFFQVGNVGPLFGQCGHFQGYAPEKIPYAIDRYYNETCKLYGVMNSILGGREYLAGDYSIADVATYPWVMPETRELHKLDIDEFPNVRRWHDAIAARPAVERGTALLADDLKYGDPSAEGFENLFGRHQAETN
jgi:GSH-dependent disulfide-bond oxidoreductase